MIKKEIFPPVRIMHSEGLIDSPEALLTLGTTQAFVGPAKSPVMKICGSGYIVLDFGREIRGGIKLVTGNSLCKGKNSVPVRVRFGESVNECMAEIGEKNAGCDHSPRDINTAFVSFSTARVGETGFRFVRLDFFEKTDAEIRDIFAEGEILDLPTLYEYKGDDGQLLKIFNTAKRTIDLCSAGEYIWDGIKRDRLVWIGDMHPEMLALATLYGRCQVFEDSMEFLKETTPLDRWMCGIYTYSAWWIICLADWYERTGAEDFTKNNIEYAEGIVSRFLECVESDGSLNFNVRTLVDWPTVGKSDEEDGTRAILVWMSKRASTLFKAFSRDTKNAEELLSRLEKRPICAREMMQVAGLKFMATGKLEEDEIALLERQGANGMSTFMSYYILKAYAHYFGKDEAVGVMKKYYNGMLSVGATSFWEDFHLDWLEGAGSIDEFTPEGLDDLHGDRGAFCYVGFRHSLCHAWSTGIIAFMKEMNL